MEHSPVVDKIVLIAALGIGAQWLAWRFRLPAIVLLTIAGLLAGPVFGWLNPQEQFGDLLRPLIAVAVAVILFEGGLHLNLEELRGIEAPVRRIVVIGAPAAWGLGAASAHWLAGLSWPVALLLGGILVVTGPTVIIPMLRQAKLERDTASVLKWEGIVNDPIGALIAVLVVEFVALSPASTFQLIGFSALGIIAAALLGFAAGKATAWVCLSGQIAEFLKGPAILGVVLICFLAGNAMQKEAGLIAVTVLGVTLANTGLVNINQLRQLKEYITVILVSGLFIILSASLERDALGHLDWGTLAFLAALLFVVRPASIFFATMGTSLSWQQRLLVGWIAPRGIVAVSIAGLFAGTLVNEGFPDGAKLVPLVFAVVIATVVLHGFSVRPFARFLGLAAGPGHGVVIVGASRWSTALAKALKEMDVRVLLADYNFHHLHAARSQGIKTFYGEILSEPAEYRIDLNQYEYVLAATDDDAYNALVCTQFAFEFGHSQTFQLAGHRTGDTGAASVRTSAKGQVLIDTGLDIDDLEQRMLKGWSFAVRTASEIGDMLARVSEAGKADETHGHEKPQQRPGSASEALIVAAVSEAGEVRFNVADKPFKPGEDDRILVFAPPRGGGT